MPLVISSSLILTSVAAAGDPDLPLIAYDNIVTTTNITATSSDASYPASRLANPATHLEWRASSAVTQYLTVTPGSPDNIEYIAIAGHNFGSTGANVSVEISDSSSPPIWTEIEAAFVPANDAPIMWRITPVPGPIRIKIVPTGSSPGFEPHAAVVMAGTLLVMQRKIYSRHLPINYGRKLVVSNGRSESGKFLGRVVIGEDNETTASFRLITPEWFRSNIPDFLEVAKESPFFFAWRPDTYPDEVGYVWLTDDPAPTPEDPAANNYIAFDLKMAGVV